MRTKRRNRFWSSSLTMVLTIVKVAMSDLNRSVSAQIIPDETLGAESSVVTPDNIKGLESERISGGAVRGSNLFHSFRSFNIGEGRGGYFENPAAIENIFSRVTGSNPSEILGTLGVLGNANLFFLNPNGIIFGQNASLDLRGSFLGTTADSILFPDGNKFSAVNPEAAPLLTVNVQQPIGLQFEGESGIITNAADLAVASRQTLSLSGSDVATTGNLTAPGGRVEVLGTNSVALLENATIDVSAPTDGGTVLIGGDFQGQGTVPNAKRTYVGDKVTINADALTNGNGGKVIVWADEVTGFYGSISARGGIESGHGGLVEVSGKEHLIFRGQVNTIAVNGLPGTLLLDPTNIIIANGSGDEGGDGTDTFAGNNSGVEGSILTATLSEIEDTAPTTIYESELEGLSGDTNIVLQATNDIRLKDLSDDSLELAAGAGIIALSADADGDGVGNFVMEDNVADTIFTNGRDLAISGANLTIGSIDTSLLAVGEAGELVETALFVSNSPGEALESISGNISNVEDVDLFQIYLTGEGNFSASTVNPETTLDTQLFLFDADGLGVYANDDQAGCNCFQATLPANDDLTPTEPGVYYLGISTFRDNAVSSGGDIFPSSSEAGFEAIRPPTGDGGLLPLSGWLGGSEQGSYIINLTGVEATEASFVEKIRGGDSGSITLNATGDININGLVDTSGNLGDAGVITLTAGGNITTQSLDSSSFSDFGSAGNGGAITLNAGGDISTKETRISFFPNSLSTLNSSSSSDSGNAGDGGAITLNAGGDILNTNSILNSSSSSDSGNAGNGGAITLNASGDIVDNGNLAGTILNSSSSSFSGNAGDGGVITLNAGGGISTFSTLGDLFFFLGILDSSSSSDSGNAGDGGAIILNASGDISTASLNSSSFSDSGNAGDGGAITLNAGGGIVTSSGLGGLDSSSFSFEGNAGNGGAINLFARNGYIIGTKLVSFSFSQEQNAGKGGDITLEAKNNIRNLEILTESSNSISGTVQLTGFENLEITNTKIITSRQFVISKSSGTGAIFYLFIDLGEKGQSGNVNITSNGNLTFNNSRIESDTKGSDPAGNVNITSPGLITFNNSKIVSDSSSTGTAGSISVSADRGITFADSNSGIFAQANAEGKAGSITVNTPELTLQQDAEISTSTTGSGKAGDITLNTPILNLASGGKLLAVTTGSGDGGTITVNAPQSVLLTDNGKLTVETSGAGKPGDITITTPSLTIGKDAELSATAIATSTNKEGGGSITVNASKLDLTGKLGIFAETQGATPAGTLNIKPDNNQPNLDIQFTDTAIISASTTASGQGGDINLTAPETINISGQGKIAVETTGTGDAGNINITAQQVNVSNQTEISASTSGTGSAGSITVLGTDSVFLDNSSISTTVNSGAVLDAAAEPSNIEIQTSSLSLTNDASVSASTAGVGNAGEINLEAIETLSIDNSTVSSAVEIGGVGNAGNVQLTAPSISVTENSVLSTATDGEGDAGEVTVTADENILMSGSTASSAVQSEGKGTAGTVTIKAPQITLSDGSVLSSSTAGEGKANSVIIEAEENLSLSNTKVESAVLTGGVGNAGNVNLTAPSISVTDDSSLSTSTAGEGDAGQVTVTASEKVSLSGSNVSSAIEPEGISKAPGTVEVTAPQISLSGGSVLSSSTAGKGNAGKINITTEELNISNQTEISASTFSSSQGGDITITANNFNLTEGATVITNTASRGQAGDIQLQIRDNLNLVNSTITASTEPNSTGKGGSINIDPQTVTLTNSQIAVNSQGQGTGGEITLQADTLTLANHSAITATTLSTDGGNIKITLGGNLVLRDNSQISTTAGTAEAGGNGGQITINAPFIIAFPQEDSDITANAFEGDGGNIIINAKGILGIEPRDEETPLSDITASSEFGQQGEVEINTSEIDPTRGLSNLPQETVEVEVAQGCQTTGGQSTLEFFAIGRGGLPPSPDDLFSSEIVISEWIPLDLAEEKLQEQTLEGIFTGDEIKNMTLLTTFPCRN